LHCILGGGGQELVRERFDLRTDLFSARYGARFHYVPAGRVDRIHSAFDRRYPRHNRGEERRRSSL
jgi:hypothetical protein